MKTKRLLLMLSILLSVAALLGTYKAAHKTYTLLERDKAADRAEFYKAGLISALEQYHYFPFVLANDPFIQRGLRVGPSQSLNERLESFAQQSNVDAIYLMDHTGLTIAASNWNKPLSYVGQNYSFRPYFKDAMKGKRGELFAIGATTLLPGYFIAEPVRAPNGDVQGVIALKVELDPLEASWRQGGERLFVTNADGVVVLSSESEFIFKTLEQLPKDKITALRQERQFANEPLDPLDMTLLEPGHITINGLGYFEERLSVGWLDWQLHYLAPSRSVTIRSYEAVLFVAIPVILAYAIYLLMRSRRIRRALRASQEEGRELMALNAELAHEIEERKAAELRLERAQKDLRKASKMAALGQLSASVSHELGQPISAMQNYLAAAQFSAPNMDEDTKDILARLGNITDRMQHITKQLKFFAGAETQSLSAFDLRDMVRNAVDLMTADFQLREIDFESRLPDHAITLYGDQLRLEQVLVNLLRNAMDAIEPPTKGLIRLEVEEVLNEVRIIVRDNGHGLPPGQEDHVFDPFFTTKPSGEGMGLGLAISVSILNDHDGTLLAMNSANGGAAFSMNLPLAEEGQTYEHEI